MYNKRKGARMIDINKKYTTRDGREVRIYAVYGGPKDTTIHGAIKHDDKWRIETWCVDRSYDICSENNTDNLIEVWEPQDKELVYAFNNNTLNRALGFYDIKNNCLFEYDGRRWGESYDNYAKVPDCLQNEPWVIKARAKLED